MMFPIWDKHKQLANEVAVLAIYATAADRSFPNNFPTEPNTQLAQRFLEWYEVTSSQERVDFILRHRGITI